MYSGIFIPKLFNIIKIPSTKIEYIAPFFKNTKELISSLKNVLGKTLFEIGLQKKKIRSGKGKCHHKNAGKKAERRRVDGRRKGAQ